MGVSYPKRNALYEMYGLVKQFEGDKGAIYPPSSFKPLRIAAMSNDYQAFKEALGIYKSEGKKWKDFLSSVKNIDPTPKGANRVKFEQSLTPEQRRKLRVAQDYSMVLRERMTRWWTSAAQEE